MAGALVLSESARELSLRRTLNLGAALAGAAAAMSAKKSASAANGIRMLGAIGLSDESRERGGQEPPRFANFASTAAYLVQRVAGLLAVCLKVPGLPRLSRNVVVAEDFQPPVGQVPVLTPLIVVSNFTTETIRPATKIL